MPAHEQPVHRPSIFAPIIENKNTEQRLRVQATYEPNEFFYIYKSNTVAGKVFFFRFC